MVGKVVEDVGDAVITGERVGELVEDVGDAVTTGEDVGRLVGATVVGCGEG